MNPCADLGCYNRVSSPLASALLASSSLCPLSPLLSLLAAFLCLVLVTVAPTQLHKYGINEKDVRSPA